MKDNQKRAMSQTVRTLELISSELVAGKPSSEVQPLFDELMSLQLPPDDIVALFKVMPRSITNKHIERVIAAERECRQHEVSQQLLTTKFIGVEGCVDAAVFARVVQHVVDTLANDAVYAADVFVHRLLLVSKSSKIAGIRAEDHLVAAIVYAINDPGYFFFEQLLDGMGTSFQPTRPATKELLSFVKTVLVEGKGVSALDAFLQKSGKDFFDRIGATGVRRKTQLVSLCVILKGAQTVSYSQLKGPLGAASEEEVEQAVVDAALANIIDVRVDKKDKVVVVRSTCPLSFGSEGWKQLDAQLKKWKTMADELAAAYQVSA